MEPGIHTYVDGAWTPPDDGAVCPFAGFGVAELCSMRQERVSACACGADHVIAAPHNSWTPSLQVPLGQITEDGQAGAGAAELVWVRVGTVQTDADEPEYIGARAHTNNTGELSAMHHALERTLHRRGVREIIHSDSLYAINMTKGKWMPRRKGMRNAPLIGRLRRLWARLRRERPGEVELRHVRSHVRVPGNELADYLAGAGCNPGNDVTLESATDWLRRWLRRFHAPGPPG